MNELEANLERIGLSQYLERFVEEGFDTWDTILYISESDLDALNVRLGHRRRLQKEIAQARNISFDSLIPQIGTLGVNDGSHGSESVRHRMASPVDSHHSIAAPTTKRKYRRHPKPDENAPERPPSAYVIFSNVIRDEIKDQKLSFTEIAKTVGERWQNLSRESKKSFESQAATVKDEYNTKLAQYKRTDDYKEYQRYLSDFKARNAAPSNDTKRPKLELKNVSGGSAESVSSSPSVLSTYGQGMEQKRRRENSMSGYVHSPGQSAQSSHASNPPPSSSWGGTEVSSPSSSTSTPTTYQGHLPMSHQSAPNQTNRVQSLPRIIPLEHSQGGSVPTANLPPINTDPSQPSYSLRRTKNARHASLLNHDTSKSSISSNISNTSTNSSAYTPITPLEEHRFILSTPSQDSVGNNSNTHAAGQGWSNTLPSGTKEQESNRHAQDGTRQSLQHFSISDNRFTNGHMSRQPAESSQSNSSGDGSSERIGVSRGGGIDALSVLALAGHMVDQESSHTKPKMPS